MAAGLTDKLVDLREIAEMLEATLPKAGRLKTYKKASAEISNCCFLQPVG